VFINMSNDISLLDYHELLDLCAKTQICVGGIRYGVMAEDSQILTHTIRQLRDIVLDMNELILNSYDR